MTTSRQRTLLPERTVNISPRTRTSRRKSERPATSAGRGSKAEQTRMVGREKLRLSQPGRRRLLRALFWAALFVGLGGGAGAGAKTVWSAITHSPRLAIREIVVRSGPRVSPAEVRALAHLSEGDNILAFRLRECVEAVESHPWVKRAAVMRELPDRVVIEVVEHEAAAIVSLGPLFYVDEEGEIFKKLGPGDSLDYPVFTGITLREAVEDEEGVTALLRQGLEVLALARDSLILPLEEISEVALDRRQGLVLMRASDNLRIILGVGGLAEKWRRMEQALVELGPETAKVGELDLNYENRVTVRLRENPAGDPAEGEKL